jgi:hypothetical protein
MLVLVEGSEDDVMGRRQNANLLMSECEEKVIIASLRVLSKRLEEERRARKSRSGINRMIDGRHVALCEECSDDGEDERAVDRTKKKRNFIWTTSSSGNLRPSEKTTRFRAEGSSAIFSSGGEILLLRVLLLLN